MEDEGNVSLVIDHYLAVKGKTVGPAARRRIANPGERPHLPLVPEEDPLSTQRQIGPERGKETFTRRRDLSSFIGEYDVPHGHKCVGNRDPYLASQVVIATPRKTQRLIAW